MTGELRSAGRPPHAPHRRPVRQWYLVGHFKAVPEVELLVALARCLQICRHTVPIAFLENRSHKGRPEPTTLPSRPRANEEQVVERLYRVLRLHEPEDLEQPRRVFLHGLTEHGREVFVILGPGRRPNRRGDSLIHDVRLVIPEVGLGDGSKECWKELLASRPVVDDPHQHWIVVERECQRAGDMSQIRTRRLPRASRHRACRSSDHIPHGTSPHGRLMPRTRVLLPATKSPPAGTGRQRRALDAAAGGPLPTGINTPGPQRPTPPSLVGVAIRFACRRARACQEHEQVSDVAQLEDAPRRSGSADDYERPSIAPEDARACRSTLTPICLRGWVRSPVWRARGCSCAERWISTHPSAATQGRVW